MKHIVLGDRQIMDFEPLGQSEEQIFYNHPAIYFVLEGTLTVLVGDTVTELRDKDFLFVNQFQVHSLEMGENTLAMGFLINQDLLSTYYDIGQMEFSGNSTEGDPENYRNFRALLENCVVYYYGKRVNDGKILLKLNGLYYQLAEQILSSYTEVRSTGPDDSAGSEEEMLIRDMMRYVQMNYQSPLKLEELADRFYLSPSYISRFFKKKMGINFGKYLTELRLDAAVRELENTEKSLTHIAMDCGFPNLAAFNKAFREKYDVNPKQHRANRRQVPEEEPAGMEDSGIAYRLLDYFEQNSIPAEEEDRLTERVEADAESFTWLNRSWNRVINIGRVSTLLQTAVQEHVLFLLEELDIEYVRIWDLYDPDLRIHAESKERKYNFTRLDMVLDFLVAHHLKPYIEMGFKPNVLLETFMNYTFYEEREILFENGDQYGAFVRSLFVHILNRYGSQEVSEWALEQWCDPRLFPEGDPTSYFETFEQAYQAVKAIAPQVRVGGDYDRTYGVIDFEDFIRRWSMRNIQPDFVSIYCYPAVANEAERNDSDNYMLDSTSLHDYLKEKRDILLKYGMNMPIVVSEWSFTVVNYNALNDSCFKGAVTMQDIMEMYSYTDAMAYWFGSDLFAEGEDPPLLLNGRCGLVTHQMIGKPSFWAMKFMNRLEPYLLARSEHVMITRNEFDSYVIACHNCRPLDIQYYAMYEREISVDMIPALFVDRKTLELQIRIRGVKNGLYHIKTRSLNSQHGSVQDEWSRMGKAEFLNQRDVDYINHISRPQISISEQNVTDHTIRITTELEAQEIQCIHLFRYVEEGD